MRMAPTENRPEPVSVAGVHREGYRADNSRMSSIWENAYHWVRKRMLSPGAQNYAFETLSLFETPPVGAGTSAQMQYRSYGGTPMYQNNSAYISGLGGLQAGQVISQPLYDPNSGSYGNRN